MGNRLFIQRLPWGRIRTLEAGCVLRSLPARKLRVMVRVTGGCAVVSMPVMPLATIGRSESGTPSRFPEAQIMTSTMTAQVVWCSSAPMAGGAGARGPDVELRREPGG